MKTLRGLIDGFRDTRGFSLAEVLMATTMLIVGVAVVLSALMYGVAGVEGSRGTSTAVFLAEQRLEQVRAFVVSTDGAAGVLEPHQHVVPGRVHASPAIPTFDGP